MFGFQNWWDGKIACTKKLLGFKIWLDGKKSFVLKNYLVQKYCLHGKKNYIEKLLGFKNWMDEKTTCIEKMLGLEKILPWKKNYIEKLLKLKNCFKHPKKRNHKKHVIRSFHIYVQYLYTNGNYRKVAQKL
jgi:hypothetical protein